jgi:hypothetical protein
MGPLQMDRSSSYVATAKEKLDRGGVHYGERHDLFLRRMCNASQTHSRGLSLRNPLSHH